MRLKTFASRLSAALIALALLASLFPLADEFRDSGATLDRLLPAGEAARMRQDLEAFGGGAEVVLIALQSQSQSQSQGRGWEPERVEAVERALQSLPLVQRTQRIALDTQTGLVLAFLDASATELEQAERIVREIDGILETARREGERALFIGTPRLRVDSWRWARADFWRLLPVLFALALAVPWICLGSIGAGLFALLLAAGTTSLTLWTQRLMQGPASPLLLLIVPLIWAVASMDALHLYGRARASMHAGLGSRDGVRRARRTLWAPCLVTTLTTAGGLVAMGGFGHSELVREFCTWSAAGVLIAYALTFGLGPAFLAGRLEGPQVPLWPVRMGRRIALCARRRPLRQRVVWGSATALAALAATRVEVASSFPRVFSAHVPLAAELDELARLLEFDLAPLEVIVEPEGAAPKRPSPLLHALVALGNELHTFPEVRRVLPVDLLPAYGLAGRDGRERYASLPPDRREAELLELAKQENLAPWLDLGRGAARVQVHLQPMSQARKRELLERLEHFDRTMLQRYRLVPAGSGYAAFLAEELGVVDLAAGALPMLAILAAILGLGFRRVRPTFAALIASLLPLVWVAGAMGACGVSWSLPLLPLPGALLGIAVDDSVHLLWPQRRSFSPEAQDCVRGGASALPAILASTGMIALCMLSMTWTSMASGQTLGSLLAFGLVVALAADLSLLPVIGWGFAPDGYLRFDG